jgi:hypothetical protein
MKLFGYIKEAVELWLKKDGFDVKLRPNASTTYTAARTIDAPAGDADHVLVSRTSTDTLTNKTLTSPTLTSPVLGTPASGTMTNVTGLPLSTGVTGTLPIANGGTGQTSQTNAFDALAPTTTKGDIIVSNGSDNIRLAVGSNGTVLTADSGETSGVKWGTALSNPMTTRGDIITGGVSGAAQRLALGTTGKMLASDGTDVIWQTGLLGDTSGTAKGSGYVGEGFGTTRSGTNAETYSDRSTTSVGSAGTNVLTRTLAKGFYLVMFKVATQQGDGTNRELYVRVTSGGPFTTDFSNVSISGKITGVSGCVPVLVTANNATIAIEAQLAGMTGSSSANSHEMWIVRIA